VFTEITKFYDPDPNILVTKCKTELTVQYVPKTYDTYAFMAN